MAAVHDGLWRYDAPQPALRRDQQEMEDQHEGPVRPVLLGWTAWQWGAYVLAAVALAAYARSELTAGASTTAITWRLAPIAVAICFFVTAVDRLLAYRASRSPRELAPAVALLAACTIVLAWTVLRL